MKYADIFRTLNRSHVRYIVVGGVAVNLHGIARATMDLDLIVALDTENILKFAKAMEQLGFKPKVPVASSDFANPDNRRRWKEEKGMIVFSFYHPNDLMAVVDVFVDEPMPFKEMYRRKKMKFGFDTQIPIASVEDLVVLKKRAGRPKDMFDLSALREIILMEKSKSRENKK